MATFKIDVQKTDSVGQFWTNVYYVDAANIDDAHTSGTAVIAAAEGPLHATFITVDKVRTSTMTPNDLVFRTSELNIAGTLATTGNALPLWNVVRADLNVTEGRPSRKFYRAGLGGANVAGGYQWDNTSLATFTTALNALRADLITQGTPLVDVDGQTIIGSQVKVRIGMRQLRRGSRRPLTPVI